MIHPSVKLIGEKIIIDLDYYEICGEVERNLIATALYESAKILILDKNIKNPEIIFRNREQIGDFKIGDFELDLRDDQHLSEVKYFIHCIKNNIQPICGIEEGKEALILGIAAKESARKKKVINMEEFKNG